MQITNNARKSMNLFLFSSLILGEFTGAVCSDPENEKAAWTEVSCVLNYRKNSETGLCIKNCISIIRFQINLRTSYTYSYCLPLHWELPIPNVVARMAAIYIIIRVT